MRRAHLLLTLALALAPTARASAQLQTLTFESPVTNGYGSFQWYLYEWTGSELMGFGDTFPTYFFTGPTVPSSTVFTLVGADFRSFGLHAAVQVRGYTPTDFPAPAPLNGFPYEGGVYGTPTYFATFVAEPDGWIHVDFPGWVGLDAVGIDVPAGGPDPANPHDLPRTEFLVDNLATTVPTTVPEPATLALLATGLAGWAGASRRRRMPT